MDEKGILKSFLKADLGPDEDLYSLMQRRIRSNYEKPALIDAEDGTRQITYRQVEEQSERIAQHLMRYGFKRTSTLVLYSQNCFEYALMAVASLRLGGKFAAVNHQLTSKDLERLLNLCDGDFVFTSADVASKVVAACQGPACQVKKIFVKGEHPGCESFSTLERDPPGLPNLPSMASLNINTKVDVACILFSSGTTGLPKATMLTHTNLAILSTNISCPSLNLFREHNLVFVPMSHIFGIGLVLLGFLAGTCSIMMSGFELNLFLANITKYQISVIHVVPPIAVLLAKHPITEQYDLTCVEGVVCGAAPLSADIEKEVCQKLKGPRVRVLQVYGLTETTGMATFSVADESYLPPGVPWTPAGSVGLLVPGFEAKVIDVVTGKTLGADQDGEILFRGPQIMKGYQKNEKATNECIDKDGWFHSGDIGHYDKNGYFFIVDRLKELIKYKGNQVAPAELEALLLTHPDIADCGVVGLPDEMAGELPHAWVVPKPGTKLTAQTIINFVEKNAAPYKRLRGGVKLVEAIPKSPSGKILRRDIRKSTTQAKL